MTFYTQLSPQSQAIKDYRHGGGQEDNPYSKTTQRPQWDAYAWKMHELWHNDFKAENQRQPRENYNEQHYGNTTDGICDGPEPF